MVAVSFGCMAATALILASSGVARSMTLPWFILVKCLALLGLGVFGLI